jgi:hypothetical protein
MKKGGPRQEEKFGTPENLRNVEIMYLQGVPILHIARKYGVSDACIHYHLNTKIKPRWNKLLEAGREQEIAKVARLEEVAWERFFASMKLGTFAGQAEIEALLEKQELPYTTILKIMRKFEKTGETSWLNIVQWCIEWRTKIGGFYAAERIRHEGSVDFRVAGQPKEVLQGRMLSRILELVKQRGANGSPGNGHP